MLCLGHLLLVLCPLSPRSAGLMVVAVAAVAVVAVAAVTVVAVAAVAGPQWVVRVALHLCTFWLLGVVVGLVAWILPAILWPPPPPPPPRVLHACTPAPLVVAWVLHVAWLVGLVACIGVMVGLVAWVAGVLEVLPKSHCKPPSGLSCWLVVSQESPGSKLGVGLEAGAEGPQAGPLDS